MTTRVGRVLGAAVVAGVTLIPLTMNTLLTTGSLGADLNTFDATKSAVVASWTPFGWAWALPFDVATGPVGVVRRAPGARGLVRRGAVCRVGAAARPHAHLAAHELGRAADRARAAPAGAARHLTDRLDRRPPGAGLVPRQPAGRHRPAHLRAAGLLRRAGGVHRHPGAGRRRPRHAGRVRRAHPDERPRLRRARLVAARRRGGARVGGPAGPGDRLDRGVRPGRGAHLRRQRGARRHLEPGVVADRGRGVVLRQPRPGRRGRCGAPGHGTTHRRQPVRGDVGRGGAGLPDRDRVVRRADAAHPPGRGGGDPGVRLAGSAAGSGSRRARSTGSACSRWASSSGGSGSTGGPPSCSASSPPPRSDPRPNFPARSRNLHVRTGTVPARR